MKKQQRLKKNEEFQQVFKRGKSTANRQFVIYALKKQEQPEFRIGLSVSKKVGKAVTRNHIKRMIKEIFYKYREQILPDWDYVVIARMPAAHMEYSEIEKSLLHVLNRAKLLKTPREKAK